MQILNYNRKLACVTVGCALWSLMAVLAAQAGADGRFRPLRMGYGPRFSTIEGRLVEVLEEDGRLKLTIAAKPGQRQVLDHEGNPLDQLPSDLQITFVDPGSGQRGQPRISLTDRPAEPRRLPNGWMEIGTSRYVIKTSRNMIRITSAPPPGTEGRGQQFGPGRGAGGDGPGGPGGQVGPPGQRGPGRNSQPREGRDGMSPEGGPPPQGSDGSMPPPGEGPQRRRDRQQPPPGR